MTPKKKNILQEAIKQLTNANENLHLKISREKDKNKALKMHNQIQRNMSMILDYKFRIEYE